MFENVTSTFAYWGLTMRPTLLYSAPVPDILPPSVPLNVALKQTCWALSSDGGSNPCPPRGDNTARTIALSDVENVVPVLPKILTLA